MGIDVSRGAKVTVPQPFLYTFKWYSACYEQTCAAVPQIMKPDLLKTVFCQKLRKLTAQIVRSDQIPHLVYKDITVVIVVVASGKSILAELNKRKQAQPERRVTKGKGREDPGHGIGR